MLKYEGHTVGGTVVKKDARYTVIDNLQLTNLVVSSTHLNPGMSTGGHSHEGQEEVYHFIFGTGEMEVGEENFPVRAGDIVLIPDGKFHRVHNLDDKNSLYFVCVFDGKRNH